MVLWAGYYSGIWGANSDGTAPQQVFDGSSTDWHPRGLFYRPEDQKVYFTNNSSGAVRKIQRMNPDGSAVQDVITGSFLGFVNDVVIDTLGRIYWTDNSNQKITRANLDGSGRQDLYVSGINDLCGLAIDPDAGKLYWTEFTRDDIRRSNLDGTGVETLVTGLNAPRHIDLDMLHGKMYWSEFDARVIQRANLNGTSRELLLSSSQELGGVSLDVPGGKMYYRDNGGLLRADLNGGNPVRLSTAGADQYSHDVLFIPEPTASLLALGATCAVMLTASARRTRG